MSEEKISAADMVGIFRHMERKVKGMQIQDSDVEREVYQNMYTRYKMEFGMTRKHPNLKRRYLYDAHDFIDSYELPVYLAEKVCG